MADKKDVDSNENLDSDPKKEEKTSTPDKDAPASFDTKTSTAFTEKGNLKSTSGLAAATGSKTISDGKEETDEDEMKAKAAADEEDSNESLASDDSSQVTHTEEKESREVPTSEENTIFSGARGTPSASTETSHLKSEADLSEKIQDDKTATPSTKESAGDSSKALLSTPAPFIQAIAGAAVFSVATQAQASGDIHVTTSMYQDSQTFLEPKKHLSALHQGDHVYTPKKETLSGGKSSEDLIEDHQKIKIEAKQDASDKKQSDLKPVSDTSLDHVTSSEGGGESNRTILTTENPTSTTHTSSSLGTESALIQSASPTTISSGTETTIEPPSSEPENSSQTEVVEEIEETPNIIEPIETSTTGSAAPSASNEAFGLEDTAINLNVSGLFDSIPASSLILIRNVPSEAILSNGIQISPDSYQLQPSDLPGLTVTPTPNSDENFELEVSLVTGPPALPEVQTISVDVEAVADSPILTASDVMGAAVTSIPLDITSELTDADGSEALFIQITGVPEDASLSAGMDLGGGAWGIPTSELNTLSYITSETSVDTTLTVTATSIETANEDINATSTAFNIDIFDQIFGTNLSDNITGTDNADQIFGLSGDDFLEGGDGIDEVNGNEGNDTIFFGNGESTSNFIDGGSGSWIDTIELKGVTQGPSATLQGAGSWVLEVDAGTGFSVDEVNKSVTFDTGDATGSLLLSDGSQADFTNIEKIEW